MLPKVSLRCPNKIQLLYSIWCTIIIEYICAVIEIKHIQLKLLQITQDRYIYIYTYSIAINT